MHIYGMDFRRQLREVRRRPGMFFGRAELRYDQLVAFLVGLDMGARGVLLDGFQEYVMLRMDLDTSVVWSSLICRACLPSGNSQPDGTDEEAFAVDGLFDYLDEFLAEVQGGHDRARLHHEFQLWRQTQDWYQLDLERFRSFPAPDVIEIDQAAIALRLTRAEVFDLIAERHLQPFRVGASIFVRKADVDRITAQR